MTELLNALAWMLPVAVVIFVVSMFASVVMFIIGAIRATKRG